ncbi:MAG: aldehyde dehydrogenase family protein [Myxococcota bacterium]
MTSFAFPEPPTAIPPTSIERADALVENLSRRKSAWTRTSLEDRIRYLRRCAAGVVEVAEAWATDGCKLKGIAPEASESGEEWLAGPVTTLRNIRLLIEALETRGAPKPVSWTEKAGRAVATVTPNSTLEKAVFSGMSAEVYIQAGQPSTQGAIYRSSSDDEGRVCLILGAGNVSSIPPMDLLYKLFVENEVVILKINPVNDYVGPHLERAFASLIDDGFLAIVYGGIDIGAHLTTHDAVDTLHVTGSDRTYDAIVWGSDPTEQSERKKRGERINDRPFSAELGCVTPVMVVPGPWSDADIEFQARNVAAMVGQNASFNCNAAKVLITAADWPLREAFISRVRAKLAELPGRKAYYPGAEDRFQRFLDHYPGALQVGEKREGVVPWTVIPEVEPTAGEYALTNEAFCGVLAEVSLDARSSDEFIQKMVPFANDSCWGTLSCVVLVHPETERSYQRELEQAYADLRYGGIAVNAFGGLIYGLVAPPWGAYPGHPPEDIQSGAGVVHNTFLFDHPEKSVVRAPFRIRPAPLWFPDHRNLRATAQRLMALEAKPQWRKVVPLVFAALRG